MNQNCANSIDTLSFPIRPHRIHQSGAVYATRAAHVVRSVVCVSVCVSVCLSVCLSRPWAVQKRRYRSRCRLMGRLAWAEGTIMGVHIGATWRIRYINRRGVSDAAYHYHYCSHLLDVAVPLASSRVVEILILHRCVRVCVRTETDWKHARRDCSEHSAPDAAAASADVAAADFRC